MKTYLTEAGTATTVEATCVSFRKPFKLLQDFQFFKNSNMSSKISSPLKTSTTRQKRVESTSKELQSKSRLSNLASRQTTSARNSANSRNSCRSPVLHKKQEQSEPKSKISDASDGSVTSVGSLTSSPKWSHIKNKFENGESVPDSKSSKTAAAISDSKKSVQLNKTTKSTPSKLENNSYIHRNKYLSARKVIDKKSETLVKSENSLSSTKTSVDKVRLNSSNSRHEAQNINSRCASPRNSCLNIPLANTSALHSSYSTKKVSGTVNSVLKSSQSSPEGSVKSSRCSSPNTVSSSSPTTKSCPSKNSLTSIPIDRSVNISLKSSSDALNDICSSVIRNSQSSNISNLSTSYLSKRHSQDSKMNSSIRGKLKFDDKPILAFNQSSRSGKSETCENKIVKKTLGSDLETFPNSTLNSQVSKFAKTRPNSDITHASNKTNIFEDVEKIKELTRNTQSGSKSVWVKDTAGNWIKKADADVKTISSSKVASLRSKFMEPNKEGNNTPLTKSSTTSSVPSKHLQNNRPLAKSSTTSNIYDKVFLDDIGKKLKTAKVLVDKKSSLTTGEVSKNLTEINGTQENRDSLKLNIVQRAILSYEGNLTLLSPETQKRLKLVTERVQAQTDDDKILRAKTKSNPQININSCHDKTPEVIPVKNSNLSKKPNVENSVGEPVLPVRNFLSRYQQKNKAFTSKEQNKTYVDGNNKAKTTTKPKESKSILSSDLSSSSLKTKVSQSSNDASVIPQKTESSVNNKSVTKLTMNFKLPNGQIDMKSRSQENDYILQPNSSFLWRRSDKAPSEFSKSSTTSSVSLTSSDYRNYYDIENYYSSLELEIDKGSENSEEHIYIDSQESNSSDNNYATSGGYGAYQNISKEKLQNGSHDEWTDMSDDDFRKNNVSSNQSSTLKKRRNKRHSSYRENSPSFNKSQNEQRKQLANDTISFTDSSDTLINDEVGNESACDLSDVNHLYEPVYECLGNYLRNQDEVNDDNCSISLSPDEPENGDFMHCSLTSLESAESSHQDKDDISKVSKITDEKNAENKKGGNKISQLKRHLSWTKNDIRLELSSKFNKIKIKKNGRNSTEIGLKMQDSENVSTSPKKKTFIKCILRQKSASSIPLKRSPSPKKESALFYVHLTMGREKQRPCSDSVVPVETAKDQKEKPPNIRQQSDSALTLTSKCNQQVPRSRKFASSHIIQRPKTPPPLPPVQTVLNNNKDDDSESTLKKKSSTTTLICETGDMDSQFYTLLDPEYISAAEQKQVHPYENEILRLIHADGKNRTSDSTSVESALDEFDASSVREFKTESKNFSSDLNLPLLQEFQTELLKSPFEEEPMYQFYQKDVQQRATLWYSVDGSESEFEDDTSSKLSDPDYQSLKRPILQSQLSAMELVHGDGGQRRLWCEVPEVVQSGILETISTNDRRIQEAMFEVITSEASYLKSLNFLTEHFVQCVEFSGDFTEKHVLDKRERHVLFSDIQPVRDVSARLLADLEKRWLKDIVLSDICDILYHHASNYFSVYVKYCSNQLYQDRLLRELKEKRPEFFLVLKRLESNAVCQGLDMHSFLMLPMQRITRLPLLIDAIFRRLSVDSPTYESCKIALATVNKIVAECNEGACKMQRMEEMLVISQQIDFKPCKGLGLLSASRWLVKKGELVQLLMDNASRRAFGRSSRWCKIQLYLFLFTDLLVVTRRKSDDSYSVVDYCPRNMLQVMTVDENTPPLPIRLPSSYRNVFQLIMLNNRDGKTVEMLLSCLLESDRTRWMNAVRPAKSENPDEKIYEEWDCPQMQCTHAYSAQQPDELSLEEADVVNVFKKMSDGWFEGERIRDGIRGWFPSSHTVEIINSHVRARNLHQRYRLLMLSQTYLEEQYKSQVHQSKK